MSFNTENNRIHVRDANGNTILDTDTPMPHILQLATVSQSVSFPTGTSTCAHQHVNHVFTDNYETCSFQNVCGYQNVCGMDYSQSPPVYTCKNEYVCENKWVCVQNPGTRTETTCIGHTVTIAAQEWEQVQNLLLLSPNQDVDFIQVRVAATRTVAGEDPLYGTFVAVVPSGQFLAQGSTILESSFLTGGASWLRRIMSVYVEGGYVKVRFRSSNRAHNKNHGLQRLVEIRYFPVQHPGFDMTYADPNTPHTSIRSNFNFTFYITVGKFTK